MKSASDTHRIGLWLAIGAAFGFSFKAVLVKLAYALPGIRPIDAITLLALRMAFAAPAFALAGLKTHGAAAPLSLKQWLALVLVGLAGYYGASILDFWGLQYVTAGLERLILYTYPTLTILFGVLFFGRRFTRRELLAMVLTYIGIGAAFAHDLHLAEDPAIVWLGAGLVFASSLSYSVYLALGGELIARLGSGRFTALAMGVATAAVFVHYLLARPWQEMFQQAWPIYALAATMALVCTVLPVFMQSAAIKYMDAGRVALIGMIGPLLTIFFGWLMLGETLSWMQFFGAALVIAGVVLVGRK